MLKRLREQLTARKRRLAELLEVTDRDLTADELREFDTLTGSDDDGITALERRVAEVEKQEQRSEAARAAVATLTPTEVRERETASASVTEKPIYQRGDRNVSYFRDAANAQLFGDREAADRIQRNARQMEERALGNTNTTGGSGGEFAPPEWIINEWINIVRPGRVTANLYNAQEVPVGVSSVNIPKLLTGTTVAVQTTQNTALSQTDLTTGFVGTGFTTVGGKQVVSQQILDQTAIDFDRVVLNDLAASYSAQIGSQVFLGTGAGANNNSVINGLQAATIASGNAITFTSGSPTAALFYSKAAGALAGFMSTRLMGPTAWVMHPRRWYWLLAQADGNGRPLVVPTAPNVQAFNAMGATTDPTPQGLAGTLLGLPVYIDPNVPTNIGAGTNQDVVYLIKQDDLWLFESAPRAEVFREPYADSLGVLFRLYTYAGTILNRLSSSIATINGTGLVAPTF